MKVLETKKMASLKRKMEKHFGSISKRLGGHFFKKNNTDFLGPQTGPKWKNTPI